MSASLDSGTECKRSIIEMVNMGVEPRTLALLAPRSKPTELIDQVNPVIDSQGHLATLISLHFKACNMTPATNCDPETRYLQIAPLLAITVGAGVCSILGWLASQCSIIDVGRIIVIATMRSMSYRAFLAPSPQLQAALDRFPMVRICSVHVLTTSCSSCKTVAEHERRHSVTQRLERALLNLMLTLCAREPRPHVSSMRYDSNRRASL